MIVTFLNLCFYHQGASVIRMLKSFIGSHHFTAGLRTYLQKYAYGNAQTEELWESMSEVSYDVIHSCHPLPFHDNDGLKSEALPPVKFNVAMTIISR